ncbi:PD40 domain-containing protein [Polyangium sorediatum]|uniref:PD40 domain-containing protein n=1 Tax=Polyangium sorediatum TaxID=889274 RepID=A0ABT6NQU1_9BACT|nr:PD40 domain-containing protein [Polyangium sorediatum]MDI1430695.1 PD40 domain-containing protein [Polyangium sorediatum]
MTTPAEPAETETEIPPELVPKKRRFWPVAAVFAALAGAAGFFGLRSLAEPEPLRVIVAVDLDGHFWDGSRASARLVNELCQRLDAIGFEPVRAGDPEVLDVLREAESPEAAAKKLRAAFIVKAKLTPETIEHPVSGGYFEVRADASFEVRHVRDEVAQSGRLVGWAGGKQKVDALRRLADTLALQAFDQVVPHLVKHPALQSIFQGNDIKLADHVAKAKKYVEVRGGRLGDAQRTYEDLEKRRKEFDKGPAKVTYHSVLGADDALGGSAAPGFLVKTADITPFVAPRTMNLSWITGLETLEWRKPGGERKLLWSGYHLFSYPAAAPDGGRVVFAEDLFGWAKTLTVVEPDGKARRLRIDEDHRFSSPEVAPGGKATALYDRPCRDCPSNLLVVSLDDGKTLYERAPEGGFFSGFAWLDPNRLAFLHMPGLQEDAPAPSEEASGEAAFKPLHQTLYVADLGASPPAVTRLYEVDPHDRFSALEASRDGKKLVMETQGLSMFDMEAGKLLRFDIGSVENPSFSPDGKLVTFTRHGDVFLFDVEQKHVRRFTQNPWKERYPLFSEDGSRIYFESTSDDPNYERRTMSLIGSVAVKDAGPPEPANAP